MSKPRPRREQLVPPVTHTLTRNEIIAGALRAFRKHGIAATRVEDILAEADTSRRTFYKLFSNVEDVLAALYELSTGELVSAIERARRARPDAPIAGIRAGIAIFLEFYRSSGGVLRDLVELAMRSDSQLAPRRRWLREELVRILDESVRALDGRQIDRFVYYALISALEGLCLELRASDAMARDLARAERVVNAMLDRVLELPVHSRLPLT
jgi:AcrR family transcriptional regulator